MSKVYSLHLIALRAGVSGPDFERFYHEQVETGQAPSGMTMRLLMGDRGDRKGNYAVLFEFESFERRNELFPEAGPAARQVSPEVAQWMGAAAPVLQKWAEYTTPVDMIYTDYVEL